MIIVTPLTLCMILALTTVLWDRRLLWQKWISCVGSFFSVVLSVFIFWKVHGGGPLHLSFGNWPAPFGIAFYVDTLSASLLCVSALIYFCGNLVSVATLSPKTQLSGYYPLFHFLMLGVFGAFSTGDLFNLYVWFEVLLMSSFFLVTLLKNRRALTGGFKYALLNILSSFVFLIGIALIYAAGGTLNLQQISFLQAEPMSLTMSLGLGFLVFAFLIKAGVFPFFFWLPASYPFTVTSMAAIFSGLLTKVGVYGLLRILGPLLPLQNSTIVYLIYVLALISMVLGVLGAISQDNMKGILSFHIISQVGYITLALSIGTSYGVAACVFYLLHHMVVKTNLFFAISYIESREKSVNISHIGGLLNNEPLLAFMFVIPALSLAGIPPLSGFWAKVFTVKALIEAKDVLGILLCLGVSLLTMISMLKIWLGGFLKPSPSSSSRNHPRCWGYIMAALLILNIWTVLMGLYSDQAFALSNKITKELQASKGDLR